MNFLISQPLKKVLKLMNIWQSKQARWMSCILCTRAPSCRKTKNCPDSLSMANYSCCYV